MMRAIRQAGQVRVSGRKAVLAEEEELRASARRSVFSRREIAAGELLDELSLTVLRSGKLGQGAAPADLPRLLSARAVRRIAENSPVRLDDVV